LRRLSYTQVETYIQCPQKWYFQYVLGWKPKELPPALVFGIAVHQAIADGLKSGSPPQIKDLSGIKDPELWMYHLRLGKTLMKSFEKMLSECVLKPLWIETSFERGGLEGKIDCIGDRDGKRLVIDWKTSSSKYEDHFVQLSDQLTAYAYLAENVSTFDGVAYCVLLKPSGSIVWYQSTRTAEQINSYIEKVEFVRRAMDRQEIFKNPGWNCSRCTFLEVCLGHEELLARHVQEDF